MMLNSLPVGCGFWDADLKRIDCSDEALRMFGLSSKEEYLRNFELLSPEYQPNGRESSEYALELVSDAFEKGRVYTEWLHTDIWGNEIPAEIQLVRAEFNGQPIVLSYTRDLRELRAAQKARNEADERNQIMLDALPICCNYWDRNCVNIDCNNAAVRLFDLSRKEEYLENFSRLPPEYQPDGQLSAEKATLKIAEAFESGYERFDWMHCKLSGELIPSEITLVRAKHSSGPIVAGYTRDLREVKAAMDEIYKTQEKLREARDLAKKTPRPKATFWPT